MGGMLLGQGSSRYDSSHDSTPAVPHGVYSNPSAPPPPPGPAPKKSSSAAPAPPPAPPTGPVAPTNRTAPVTSHPTLGGAPPKAPTAPKTVSGGAPPPPPPAPAAPAKASATPPPPPYAPPTGSIVPTNRTAMGTSHPTLGGAPPKAPTAPKTVSGGAPPPPPPAPAPAKSSATPPLPPPVPMKTSAPSTAPSTAPRVTPSKPADPIAPPIRWTTNSVPAEAKSHGTPTAPRPPPAKPYGVPASSTPTAVPKATPKPASPANSRYAPDGLDYDTMDPELADILRKIDENVGIAPAAPPAPSAPKRAPIASVAAPPKEEEEDTPTNPELAAAMQRFRGGNNAQPVLPVCTRPIPSNVNKNAIIRASDSYMAPIIRKFRSVKFSERIVIDWDTILSDPGFIDKYPDPTKILGERSGKYAKSFQTSMECWADTMTAVCGSNTKGTPERELVTAIKQFIITVDMSLPEYIEPTWNWNTETKVLTTIHNPLSLVDGPALCYYRVDGQDNGTSTHWWPGLYFLLNGNSLTDYLKKRFGQNTCPQLDLTTLTPRSTGVFRSVDPPGTIRECEFCFGKGYYANSGTCKPCRGTGRRKQ